MKPKKNNLRELVYQTVSRVTTQQQGKRLRNTDPNKALVVMLTSLQIKNNHLSPELISQKSVPRLTFEKG